MSAVTAEMMNLASERDNQGFPIAPSEVYNWVERLRALSTAAVTSLDDRE
jgi:hypothetical protein